MNCKSAIRSLGSVNVAAIEEYKEVAERYQFYKEQIDDVQKAREDLLKLIRDLTSRMQELFRDSFEKIKGHFATTFVDLFGGGTGGAEPDRRERCACLGYRYPGAAAGAKRYPILKQLSGGRSRWWP